VADSCTLALLWVFEPIAVPVFKRTTRNEDKYDAQCTKNDTDRNPDVGLLDFVESNASCPTAWCLDMATVLEG